MTGWWKAGKSGSRISPSFHHPLEIPQQRRDSHIPTAPATGSVDPNQNRKKTGCLTAAANPTRKENQAPKPHSQYPDFQDHSVLETISRFRIILRLENAQQPEGA
jgi:hypothetical protein